MHENILNFGMKYSESKCWPLRFAADLCISLEKRMADRIERELKRENIKGMDANVSQKVFENLWKVCVEKE